jgi:hypothetical protein
VAYSEAIAGRIRKILAGRRGIVEKKMFDGIAFLLRRKMLIGVLGEKVVARCRPEDQPRLLKSPHVKPMDFTGRPMKGWLFVTGPASPALLRKWIASGEAAMRGGTPSSR